MLISALKKTLISGTNSNNLPENIDKTPSEVFFPLIQMKLSVTFRKNVTRSDQLRKHGGETINVRG